MGDSTHAVNAANGKAFRTFLPFPASFFCFSLHVSEKSITFAPANQELGA